MSGEEVKRLREALEHAADVLEKAGAYFGIPSLLEAEAEARAALSSSVPAQPEAVEELVEGLKSLVRYVETCSEYKHGGPMDVARALLVKHEVARG